MAASGRASWLTTHHDQVGCSATMGWANLLTDGCLTGGGWWWWVCGPGKSLASMMYICSISVYMYMRPPLSSMS
jgi:hypothetical protein